MVPTASMSWGIPWPKIGISHYQPQLGLPDRCLAIKNLVVKIKHTPRLNVRYTKIKYSGVYPVNEGYWFSIKICKDNFQSNYSLLFLSKKLLTYS